MSLEKRNIIFHKGTTDGFQLIPQPARTPFGGVAFAEKDDDAVPYDQMVEYVAANAGVSGGSGDMLSSTYDPLSFTDACLFGFQEIAVNDAQYMVSTNTVWNLRDQPIKIVSGTTSLPTGIHHVLTKIIFNPSNQYRFDNVGEAYVTALGVYVPCSYDVATNKISIKQVVYAINLTQTAGGDVNTVNKTFTNLLGETPVITKDSDGVININTTTFAFTQYQVGLFAPAIYDSGSTSLFVPTLAFIDANNLRVSMTKASDGTAVDDIYNNTYLEFYILIAN